MTDLEASPAAVGRLRRLFVDTSPLQESPEYRRLWLAQALSFTGSQVTQVAVPLQVYAITHSSLAVGLTGAAALGPLVLFGLLGGSIADSVDRRRLVLITSTGLALCSALLTAQAIAGLHNVGLLYLLVAIQAGFGAVDSPGRRTFPPRLLPPEKMPAVSGLDQVLMNLGVVGGPLIAGVLIATVGRSWAYGIDTLSFVASLYAVFRLPPMPPEGGGHRAGVASVLEGLRFLRTRRNLLMTFLVDINAMVFGMPRALFPALAVTRFHGGATTAGVLYAAPAAGALLGAVLGGWFGRINRQGLAVLVAVAAWGASIAGFGLTTWLWLAFVFLAAAGAADMVSAVFRNSILNVAAPDRMRGRLSGVFIVVVTGGPRVGDVEAGAVAALTSPVFSVVSGGLACIAGVLLLAARWPSFARYDARHPVP